MSGDYLEIDIERNMITRVTRDENCIGSIMHYWAFDEN